jgi:hypothetical protein
VIWVIQPELPRELDDEHASVRQDSELERSVKAFVKHSLFEAMLLKDGLICSLERREGERQREREACRHGAQDFAA